MFARFVAMMAVVAVGAAALAQQTSKPNLDPVYTDSEADIIKVDVARVPLLFTVTDKKNRFITDLGRKDFQVYDNGWQQQIREFDRESDLHAAPRPARCLCNPNRETTTSGEQVNEPERVRRTLIVRAVLGHQECAISGASATHPCLGGWIASRLVLAAVAGDHSRVTGSFRQMHG